MAVKAAGIGGIPWIAVILAVSFGFYGLIRKRMGVDVVTGMFVETAMLVPFYLGYLWWMAANGQPIFFGGGAVNVALALLAGVITARAAAVLSCRQQRVAAERHQSALLHQPDQPLDRCIPLWGGLPATRSCCFRADLDRARGLFHRAPRPLCDPTVNHLCGDNLVRRCRRFADSNVVDIFHALLDLTPRPCTGLSGGHIRQSR